MQTSQGKIVAQREDKEQAQQATEPDSLNEDEASDKEQSMSGDEDDQKPRAENLRHISTPGQQVAGR